MTQAVLDFPRGEESPSMRLRDRLDPRSYEERLQDSRRERDAETKRAERLSAVLAKKASSAKAKEFPDRAA